MAKKTEKVWASRVAAWRTSGQTAAEFAVGKGFAPSTLRYWASKLKRKEPRDEAITFARVERVECPTRPAVIVVGAAVIEVFADTDEVALAKALRAVGAVR